MNDIITIAPIVEGDGEVTALPVLIRRICHEIVGLPHVDIRKPWKLPRGKIVKPEELSRVVQPVSRSVGVGGILVVLDQDDDSCTVDLASALVHKQDAPVKIEAVIAAREYEAWFLAAVESLRGHRAIQNNATYGRDPESPRDAKGRLESLMTESYRETLHQASFSSMIDLGIAVNNSRSFRRMVSAVEKLCSHSDL